MKAAPPTSPGLAPDRLDEPIEQALRGKQGCSCRHGSIFPEVGAFEKPGAVHIVDGRLDPDAQSPDKESAKPFDSNENNPA